LITVSNSIRDSQCGNKFSLLQLLLANMTMAEEGATSTLAKEEKVEDTTERGKAARKSDNITNTPARAKVTPNGKQNREREQDPPKKSRGDIKKGIKDYFGKGKRVSALSMEGDLVTTVVQRCTYYVEPNLPGQRDRATTKARTRSPDQTTTIWRRQGQESNRRHRKEGGPGRVRGRPQIDGRTVEKEEHEGQTKQGKGAKRCKGKEEEEDVISATRRDTRNGKKKGKDKVAICFECVVGFAI
jgi:hypothetical protein